MASGEKCLPITEVLKSDYLTCSICMNVYDKPKILPCLHTYCENCLSNLIASKESMPGKITCPECRDVTELPAAGVQALRTCFFIGGLIDLYHTKTAKGQLCSLCSETKKSTIPAVAHCIDCADDLCSTCSAGHCCSRLTAHHRVVELDDLGKGTFDEDLRTRQKILCSLHGTEELRYYCETCRITICRDCRLLTHIDHTCKSISEAVTAIVPVVKNCIEDLKTQLTSISEHRQILESKIVQLHDFRKAGLAQVDHFTQRLISCLHEESQKATRSVCERFDLQEKPLLSELQEIQTREAVIHSSVNFSSRTLENARDAEILSLVDLLHTRLQKLNSHDTKSITDFPLDNCILYSRICPETVFESVFEFVQINKGSSNLQKPATVEPIPDMQHYLTSTCSQESSSFVEKTVELRCEDGVQVQPVKQDLLTLITHTKLESVPYNHVHEMSTERHKPNWVVEKTVKLRLKEDVATPRVAGMILNFDDTLFITDINNKKVKMSSNTGKFIKTVPGLDGEVGLSGLANCGEEVVCACTARVCMISNEGEVVKKAILIPRKTNYNHNIAVYMSKYICIAEGDLGTVSTYQTTGKVVRRLTLPASSHDSKPPRPAFVAFNKRGHLIVVDWAREDVVILTIEGQPVRRFTFDHHHPPCCICVDDDGRVFLSCFGSQTILCLKDENARWTPVLSLGCEVIAGCPLIITAGRQGRLYVSIGDGQLRIYRQT